MVNVLAKEGITLMALLPFIKVGLIIVVFYAFLRYNIKLLKGIAGLGLAIKTFSYKLVGKRIRETNRNFKRSAHLSEESISHKTYMFFDKIIDDLNMQKDGITVTGLVLFIGIVSLLLTLAINIVLPIGIIIAPAILVLLLVAFKYKSIGVRQKKESYVMDAVDLIVSDISGGVERAIKQYMDNYHPDVRPYFEAFKNNIDMYGMSFTEAMIILNNDLGYTFSNFANKAIIYEKAADATMERIFSDIIEGNRQTRVLRNDLNKSIMECKITLVVSMTIILLYVLVSIMIEPFIYNFMANTGFGKFLCMVDVIIVTVVIGYLTSLQAKI